MKTKLLRPRAVILDMDGSLCDITNALHHVYKKPKDWDSFHRDVVNCPPNLKALDYAEKRFLAGDKLLVVTARMQMWHSVSTAWLKTHVKYPFDGPFMRADGDTRTDVQVKREIYHYLSLSYDIRGALEDSPNVIKLWKSLGLQVEEMPRIDWRPDLD